MQHYAATAAMQGYAYAAVGIKSPFDKVMWGPLLYRTESEICAAYTPPRTPRISRIKSQILKPTFLS